MVRCIILGADKTFNVTSESSGKSRSEKLDNYNVHKPLQPHTDHAHYHYPIQIMGLYQLEGISINTWVDGFGALHKLKIEDLDHYNQLCTTPMSLGRTIIHRV